MSYQKISKKKSYNLKISNNKVKKYQNNKS